MLDVLLKHFEYRTVLKNVNKLVINIILDYYIIIYVYIINFTDQVVCSLEMITSSS